MKAKVALFVGVVLAVVVLIVGAMALMGAPTCEQPPTSWLPCLPIGGQL